jgi:hypothetical protein
VTGRHHAPARDRLGNVLTAAWLAGHAAAALLLGCTIHAQQELHGQPAAIPHSTPDREPSSV